MEVLLTTYHPRRIIEEIGKRLDLPSQTSGLEEIIDLSKHYGKGTITSFNFSDGISLFLLNCEFKEDWTLLFDKDIFHPLQFNLNIEGGIKHFFNNQGIQYFLNPLQGTITANKFGDTQGFQFPKDQKITFISLMINRQQYAEKIDTILGKIPEKLNQVFTDVEAQFPFFYQGNYSMTSSECAQTIVKDQHTGLVRSTYLEGISLELLSYQIKQFRDDLASPGKQVTLRQQDIDKILEARNILLEQLQDPPVTLELSKQLGVNQTKLKSGFKKLFDKPIKTWLRDKRLETAKLLLLDDTLSIREIAERVGYTNQSYFSKRFHEKYGALPKDFAKALRAKYVEQ